MYGYFMNHHKLGKINLICYFVAELRICVLKIAVLRKNVLKSHFWKFIKIIYGRVYLLFKENDHRPYCQIQRPVISRDL